MTCSCGACSCGLGACKVETKWFRRNEIATNWFRRNEMISFLLNQFVATNILLLPTVFHPCRAASFVPTRNARDGLDTEKRHLGAIIDD